MPEDRYFIKEIEKNTALREKEAAEEEIRRDYFLQTTINSILQSSLEHHSLEKQLDIILDKLLAVPWLALKSKGCIYLVENKPHFLKMKAQRGFSQSYLTSCSEIPFGKYICGQAALTRKILFSDAFDEFNSSYMPCYFNLTTHSLYCVPIVSGNMTLGVMCLFLAKGHKRDYKEEEFLSSVASTVAGIIERKRTEEALKYERDFAESLIETAQVIVLLLNKEGRILRFNPYLEEISGYSINEVRGMNWFETFIPERERQRIRQAFFQSLDGSQTQGTINSIITKEGKERIIEWYDTTLKDKSGYTIGILATGQDITERMRAEKALKKAHRELKDSQAQLIQAEKMSAVGTLVAGVAHEMNNPLMGIMNFAQYALKHIPNESKVHGVLKNLEEETERCIEIVQNLLTFSHTNENVGNELKKEHLQTIIERVLKLLSFRIERKKVVIRQHISQEIPSISVNTNALQQVFLNILTNALDAVRESKKKEIHIRIERKVSDLYVHITDTGCGIISENLKMVFDPFFTTKPVGQGTGLGLSVSHSIVKAHRGQIFCESSVGKGSTFTVVLPIR